MAGFTRLTVVGSSRRAELVVPDDEAIAGLVGRLMELLAEPVGSLARPLVLVRASGEQLEGSSSAAEQQLADGEQLRLVRADEAPPPPEVADVTDVLADSYEVRAGRGDGRVLEAAGAVAVGTLVTVASFSARGGPVPVVVVLVAVLAVGAAALGRTGRRWAALAGTAAAAGLAPRLAVLLAALHPWPLPSGLVDLALALAVGWLTLALGVGVGLRRGSALAGSLLGALLSALPVVLVAAAVRPLHALGVDVVLAVLACGLLPWWALSVSGLTGLDDQVLAGAPCSRAQVHVSVDGAYAALSWATFAVAPPVGLGAGLLLGAGSGWAAALGLAVLTVTALRTRAFPLAVQQLPLWVAAVLGLALGLARQPRVDGWPGVALLVAVAVIVVGTVALRPTAHARARWRRLGNLVEAVAVIVSVPLLLGLFGIYAELVGAFR